MCRVVFILQRPTAWTNSRARAVVKVIESRVQASNHWLKKRKIAQREEQNLRSRKDSPPQPLPRGPHLRRLLSSLPRSYLFVGWVQFSHLARCLCSSHMDRAAFTECLLLSCRGGGIVSRCQSTRLQLRRLLIAHPPKISFDGCKLRRPDISEKRARIFSPIFGSSGVQNSSTWDVFRKIKTGVWSNKGAISETSHAFAAWQTCTDHLIRGSDKNHACSAPPVTSQAVFVLQRCSWRGLHFPVNTLS